MKRIAFFLIAALAIGMTACENKTNPPEPETPKSTEWTVRFEMVFSKNLLSLLEQPITMTYTLPGQTEVKTIELADYQPYSVEEPIFGEADSVVVATIDIAHVGSGTLTYQLHTDVVSNLANKIEAEKEYTFAHAFWLSTKGNQDEAFSVRYAVAHPEEFTVPGENVAEYMALFLSAETGLLRKSSIKVPYQPYP